MMILLITALAAASLVAARKSATPEMRPVPVRKD